MFAHLSAGLSWIVKSVYCLSSRSKVSDQNKEIILLGVFVDRNAPFGESFFYSI